MWRLIPMVSARLITALLMVTIVVTAHAFQGSPRNRPWPPGVQQVPAGSPPLSPEEALKTFHMPPGYHLELVASEPLIQEPVAIDWDTDGRLWAVEMPGFMANITGSNEHEPIGRVVVLEDTDGDGRMDRRTVFADGLVLARSVKILDHGVLVAEPPNVWLMHDTNGDLRMDSKELVTNQYGRREGDPQENANGFDWALDNRMHTAGQADIELRLKNGAFEVQKTLQRGEWGVTHDDAGRTYRNTNESALHADLVPTAYFARNPNLLRTRGSYERLAADSGTADELNIIWPVRPNPGTNRAYQTGIDRADGSLERFTSVCAPVVYRGDRLPPDLYGNVFVAEPAANLVSRLVLTDDGSTVRARKAYDRGEFLASTDERFRPVYLSNAPDGTLYIVDMYRGIIEHRLSLTVYLRDYILARTLEQATGFGRIYRVVHDTTQPDVSSSERRALSKASPTQLVEALSDANGWTRDTAQRLLVERLSARSTSADGSVVPALVKLAANATDPRTRLHALWTLDGIDAIEPAIVERALEDTSRDVRASAIRIAERWLGEANHPIQAAVLKRLDDPDWAVRYQLAASLGAMPPGPRETAAVRSARTTRRRSVRCRRRPERAAGQRNGCDRADAAGRRAPDAESGSRHHHARGDCGAKRTGRFRTDPVGMDRRQSPAGLAAIRAAARCRSGVAWRANAGCADWTTGWSVVCRIAVSDVSRRASRSWRRIRVLEAGRLRRGVGAREWSREHSVRATEPRTGRVAGAGRRGGHPRPAGCGICSSAWPGRANPAKPRRSHR